MGGAKVRGPRETLETNAVGVEAKAPLVARQTDTTVPKLSVGVHEWFLFAGDSIIALPLQR